MLEFGNQQQGWEARVIGKKIPNKHYFGVHAHTKLLTS